jgi:catecholate siderophore receptor
MKKITRKHGVALLAIALANFNLSAQDGGGATSELNPLNVIGSKGETPTLSSGLKSSLAANKTPQGFSIMSSEQIKLQGLKSVGDVIDYTPGVNNSQGEGHRDAAVIRGVRTTQDFYRDGIRDDVQYYRPLYNIEQVEVIRGPNALVSGFGGAYGFINRVSKKGVVGESFNSFSASVDTFGETIYQMDNNIELSDNTALRINMYGDNLENHRDYYYGDSFGVNPTLRMNLGDGSTLDLSYEYINQERFIDRGIPTGLDGRPVESLKDYVFADPVENFSNHEANFFKAIYEHEVADGLTGKLAFSHSDQDKLYKNVYVSGYFNSASQGFTTAALPIELDGYVDTTQRNSTIFSYSIEGEFETGSMVHNVFAALEYTSTENNNDRYHADFDPSAADADWADEAIFALSRTMLNGGFGTGQHENNLGTDAMLSNNYTTRRSDLTEGDLSVFSLTLQDEISFNDRLDLIIGARLDNMEYDVNSFDRSNVVTPLTDSDDTISPRIGVIYDLTEQATIYASYSESFSPVGGDQYASFEVGGKDVDPNSFENTEFGFRYDLLNGLTLSASYFIIDSSVADEFPANSGLYEFYDSETTGFEVQLQGSLTDNWFISAGYASLDAEDPDGNRVREAPENMLSVWNNYNVTDRLAVNLGIVHQDDSQIGSGTSPILPAYTRVDVGATMLVTDNTSIQFNVENVTDELYFPHSHSTHQASVGAPVHATFGITSSF